MNVKVLADDYSLAKAHEEFNEDGSLKDAEKVALVKGIGRKLAEA